ncbi:hypothetical protein T09_14207, partial [Trichinella sp. T9]
LFKFRNFNNRSVSTMFTYVPLRFSLLVYFIFRNASFEISGVMVLPSNDTGISVVSLIVRHTCFDDHLGRCVGIHQLVRTDPFRSTVHAGFMLFLLFVFQQSAAHFLLVIDGPLDPLLISAQPIAIFGNQINLHWPWRSRQPSAWSVPNRGRTPY